MRLQRLTGLEQDKIVGEYKEVMAEIADLLDILSPRRRASRPSFRKNSPPSSRSSARPRWARAAATIEHNAQDLGDRRPDHAHRHGGDALAHRLHQEPAAGRVPGAKARRPRQAGHADQGRRLDRPALHRQHARLHPVLHQRAGRVYWLKVWEVPQGSRNSRGKPIVNMFPLQPGEKVNVVLPLTDGFRSFPGRPLHLHGDGARDRSRRPRSTSSATRARPASSRSTSTKATS